jgi:hypothetical protein
MVVALFNHSSNNSLSRLVLPYLVRINLLSDMIIDLFFDSSVSISSAKLTKRRCKRNVTMHLYFGLRVIFSELSLKKVSTILIVAAFLS